ncbi:MAG: hypothetical protein R3B54_12280 [Bdellovibrionota bacterium]
MIQKLFANLPQKISQLEAWVHKAGEWRYLPVFIFLWTLADFFTLVLPADAVFLAAVYACSRRVLVFSVAVVLARVLGTFLLYELAHELSVDQMFAWAAQWNLVQAWENSRYFFEKFGPLSLGLVCLLPFPPMQFVIVLSAAAGATLLALELYLVVGLSIKCAILYFLVKSGIYMVEKAKHHES